MKRLPLTILLAATALAGCETTVNLPEPPHTPRVALLYTLTTAPQDSSFGELYNQRQLYISNSQRVFDTREPTGRADATVELRDAAGAVVERYRHLLSGGQIRGFYRPVLGFRPQVGQAYTLRASLPGLLYRGGSLRAVVAAAMRASATSPQFPGGAVPCIS